jgi:uncharacterized membrane protein YphA (DoxX/SURF4 family)
MARVAFFQKLNEHERAQIAAISKRHKFKGGHVVFFEGSHSDSLYVFGMAEVLSGFLLMIGVFTRLWSLLMFLVMTKLMLIDFGWAEIPHIYLIGALLVVIFSNKLTNELSRFEAGRFL